MARPHDEFGSGILQRAADAANVHQGDVHGEVAWVQVLCLNHESPETYINAMRFSLGCTVYSNFKGSLG